MVGQRRDEERQLVGRGRHVGVGEDHEVGLGGQHPGTHRRALAAVRDADDPQRDALDPGGFRSGGDQGGRAVGAAVVDHEDLDLRRQTGRTRRTPRA